MDLDTLTWDADIAADMGIPLSMLPEIRSSSEVYGNGPGEGLARRGADRRHPRRPAGGHLRPGLPRRPARPRTPTAPATSCCINTGTEEVPSKNGLLTTVCYKIGDQPTGLRARGLDRGHRLAGAVAARQPRPDRLGAGDRELAATVEDNGGCYFVPAFSGLFAPYWRSDARGAHRRPDPVRQQGAHRPGRARGHRVPDQRGAGRDERRLRVST